MLADYELWTVPGCVPLAKFPLPSKNQGLAPPFFPPLIANGVIASWPLNTSRQNSTPSCRLRSARLCTRLTAFPHPHNRGDSIRRLFLPKMARVYADVNQNMPRSYWDYDSVNISKLIYHETNLGRRVYRQRLLILPGQDSFPRALLLGRFFFLHKHQLTRYRLGSFGELRGRSQDRYVFLQRLGVTYFNRPALLSS